MYIVSEIKIRSIIQDRVDIFYIFNDFQTYVKCGLDLTLKFTPANRKRITSHIEL